MVNVAIMNKKVSKHFILIKIFKLNKKLCQIKVREPVSKNVQYNAAINPVQLPKAK